MKVGLIAFTKIFLNYSHPKKQQPEIILHLVRILLFCTLVVAIVAYPETIMGPVGIIKAEGFWWLLQLLWI